MADYGFGGGLASGLQSGLSLGTNIAEIQNRNRVLQQEQLDEKIKFYGDMTSKSIDNIQKTLASSRLGMQDPKMQEIIGPQADAIRETSKQLVSFGGKGQAVGQFLDQSLATALQTPGTATVATNELQGKMDAANAIVGLNQSSPAQPQPQAPQPQPIPTEPTAPLGAGQEMATGDQPHEYGVAQAGVGSQASAAPQPVQNLKPLVNMAPSGIVDIRDVPYEAVEALIAYPTQDVIDKFTETYGVDPSSVIKELQAPSSYLTPEQRRDQLIGIKDPGVIKGAEEKGKAFEERSKRVRDAKKELALSHVQREAIRSEAGVFSGYGANLKLQGAKLAKAVFGRDDPKIANTESLILAAGQKAASIIKNFGAGTGLSDADLKFAMQLAAGDITLDVDSIERWLDITSKANIYSIVSENSVADDVEKTKQRAATLVSADTFKKVFGGN